MVMGSRPRSGLLYKEGTVGYEDRFKRTVGRSPLPGPARHPLDPGGFSQPAPSQIPDRFGRPIQEGDSVLFHSDQDLVFRVRRLVVDMNPANTQPLFQLVLETEIPLQVPMGRPVLNLLWLASPPPARLDGTGADQPTDDNGGVNSPGSGGPDPDLPVSSRCTVELIGDGGRCLLPAGHSGPHRHENELTPGPGTGSGYDDPDPGKNHLD